MAAHSCRRRLRGARLPRALAVALAVLLLAACGASRTSALPGLIEPITPVGGAAGLAPSLPRVALVLKAHTNPFFAEMERGARQAAAEQNVELIVKTVAQETSVDQQIVIIERLIADHVDAIVIAPGDSARLVPVLRRAQARGIVIINVDNRLDAALMGELGLRDVPFISVDNEQGAYLVARHLSRRLPGPAEVIILEGVPTARNSIDRTAGALRAFNEDPHISVAAVASAHWKIDEAYLVTRELLAAHPGVRAIFCANDMMALGALRYLAESGRQATLVGGFDALDEARQAIADGRLTATVDQQAASQGYLGVVFAVKALAGEELPAETLVPVRLITAPDHR